MSTISNWTDCNWVSSTQKSCCRMKVPNHLLFSVLIRSASGLGPSWCRSSPQPFREFLSDISRNTMGCKLHQYILNREPVHFKNTIFLVDRFHWRGHVGCSSGYSLDSYTSLDVAAINSQVNKQANAGLQRIKGHIAYMKPDNFMFHVKPFLGLQNRDKQSKLDVGNLKHAIFINITFTFGS